MDRIDLHVEVIPVNYNELSEKKKGEKSSEIRKRVIAAREIQQQRFKEINNVHCNAQMTTKMVNKYCQLNDECNESIELMTRHCVEVVATLLNTTATVNNALTTIDHNNSANSVCSSHDRFQIGASGKGIRGLGNGNKLGARVD